MAPPVKIIIPEPPKKKKGHKFVAGMFFGLVMAGMFSAVLFAFAVPPDTKYDFGATLEPSCSPGSTNCSVVAPAQYSFAANNFSGSGNFSGGAITGTSFVIGANSVSSLANLSSLSGLAYASAAFVKMTGVNTFTLDTNTYITSLNGAVLITGESVGATVYAQQFTNGVITGKIYPSANSVTAVQINKADGSTSVMNVDTTNARVGIGNIVPGALLDVGSAGATLGTLRLEGNTSGYVQIQPAAAAGSWTWTFPENDGDVGQVLSTNGSGVLSWINTTGVPGGANTNVQYNSSGVFGGSANFTYNGSTLNVVGTAAAQQKLSYNGSIYSTFTVGSDGTLTVANTGGATGDIILNPTGAGNVNMLSDTGIMGFGGYGNTNNEDLTIDFETTSNTAGIASTTGVTNITWTGNLTLGGNTTVGTLVTRVAESAPTEADVNGSLVVDSGDGGRIYFRYGGAWHYVAQTAGFQIPEFETNDPISGEKINEGDIVLGMINKKLGDNALHGVWVKWESVKEQLLAEARGQLAGGWGSAGTTDSSATLADRVANVLSSMGIAVKDGIATISQLFVDNLTARNARVQTLEMVDKATGEIYCTWVENGEMLKAKGECGSINVARANPQPVGQSVEQAKDILDKASLAASKALEASKLANTEAEENARQAVENAAKEAAKELQPAPLPVQEEQPAPAEEQPTQPAKSGGTMILEAASGLLNGIWEFFKAILRSLGLQMHIAGFFEAVKSTAGQDFNTILMGIKSIAGF